MPAGALGVVVLASAAAAFAAVRRPNAAKIESAKAGRAELAESSLESRLEDLDSVTRSPRGPSLRVLGRASSSLRAARRGVGASSSLRAARRGVGASSSLRAARRGAGASSSLRRLLERGASSSLRAARRGAGASSSFRRLLERGASSSPRLPPRPAADARTFALSSPEEPLLGAEPFGI